jgi:hypothetical protein
MSKLLVVGVVAVLLLGGALAADLALSNPDLEPADATDDSRQQQFTEVGGSFIQLAAPIALFGGVAAAAIAGVQAMRRP